MATEIRRLSLHPMAIHTFIKAQAGSLAKALSESVMNSFDAFASSVEISVNRTGYTVVDDGQGFRDKDEIASWFETLGFPHDEGNHRTWGTFGMGRAQAWAYASTIWESNTFRMNVDVQRTGLEYELDIIPAKKGTSITGTFYNPLDTAGVIAMERELTELVKFVSGPVYLNGKLITQDPALKQWPQETDDAWMEIRGSRSGSLSVYNAGVLVKHYGAWQFGVEGVIVTKPDRTLQLNLARNEILVSSCPVWRRLQKSFPKPDQKAVEDKPKRTSEKNLEHLGRALKTGQLTLEEAFEASYDLVRDVGGRALVLDYLVSPFRMRPVTVMPKGDEAGKRLMRLRKAFVIAQESLDALGMTFAELRDIVFEHGKKAYPKEADQRQYYRAFEENLPKCPWSEDAKELFPDFFAGRTVLKLDELKPNDRAAFAALQYSWRCVTSGFLEVCEDESAKKRIGLLWGVTPGDSADTVFWKDGGSVVIRAKELVALQRSSGEACRFINRILRAYAGLVMENDTLADALFVKLVTETSVVGELTSEFVRRYVNKCRAEGLELSTGALRAVSSAEQLDGALDDEKEETPAAPVATAAAM